jgi:hypothetical protein
VCWIFYGFVNLAIPPLGALVSNSCSSERPVSAGKNWLDFILRFLEAYESHYGHFDAWNLDDLDVDDILDELWSADHKTLLDLWLDRVLNV